MGRVKFFIRQVELILDAQNLHSKTSEVLRAKINKLIPKALAYQESYVTVYYDAWSNATHKDPILSLIKIIIIVRSGLEIRCC